MKKYRPNLDLPDTSLDKKLRIASVIGIALMFGLVVFNYASLPDRIPIHFGFTGKPDGYGDKVWIWLIPVITVILFLFMDGVRKIPHTFNYPVKITENNVKYQYGLARTMMAGMNLCVVFLFLSIVWNTILVATGKSSQLGFGVVILTFLLIFIPILVYSKAAKKVG